MTSLKMSMINVTFILNKLFTPITFNKEIPFDYISWLFDKLREINDKLLDNDLTNNANGWASR